MRQWVLILILLAAPTLSQVSCGHDTLVCRGCETDSDTIVDVDSDSMLPMTQNLDTDHGGGDESAKKLYVLHRDFNGQTTGEASLKIVRAVDDVRESEFADHNTVTSMGGEDCLKIHADTVDDASDWGRGVEIQLQLDQLADMRDAAFMVSFDMYIPEAYIAYVFEPLFGLYRTGHQTGIYSKWYPAPIESGWRHIEGVVRDVGGDIVYSSMEQDPGSWIFDALRIYVFVQDTDENVEVEFCLDNIQVYRP